MINRLKTCLFFLFITTGIFSQSFSDIFLTLHADQKELKEILDQIQRNYDIHFSWSPETIDHKPITIHLDSVSLEKGLNLILDQADLSYQYILSSQTIVIFKRKNKKLLYHIFGYVRDKYDHHPLIGVNIIDSVSLQGTFTDQSGYFHIYLPQKKVKIHFTHVGYKPVVIKKTLTSSLHLSIQLEEWPEQGETITIIADRNATWKKLATAGHIEFSQREFNLLPSLLGGADVGLNVQFSPGVQSGNDGSSGWFVRGGNPSQNLVLLDNAPIYNSNHFYGFFSVFNPATVKNIEVIKSSFPAQYGGRVSSVINVKMKQGDFKTFSGKINSGFLASQFMLNGPVIKNKSSFIVSGRRSYMDYVARLVAKGELDVENYYFNDFYSKYTHLISEKMNFSTQFYRGRDIFSLEEQNNSEKSHWGNTVLSASFNYFPTRQMEFHATGGISNYNYKTENKQNWNGDIYKSNYSTAIRDIFSKLSILWKPTQSYSVTFGSEYMYHQFEPGILSYQYRLDSTFFDAVQINHPLYSSELNFFLDNNLAITQKLNLNLGLRASTFNYDNKMAYYFNPRFNLSYIHHNFALRIAYSNLNQNIHMVTSNGTGQPKDIWIPATQLLKPEISKQISIGINKKLNENTVVDIEIYQKKLKNLVEFKDGFNFIDVHNSWQKTVEKGRGRTVGIEFFMIRKQHDKTFRLIYNLSKSTRTFSGLNNGESFPYRYDRTHDIKMNFIWQFSRHWDFSSNWFYATGMAVSIPNRQYYAADGTVLLHYDKRNNFRIPPYHRLDLSLHYHLDQQEERGFNYAIGVFNIYNRRNPYYIYLASGENNQIELRQLTVYPILPYFTVGYNF